MRLILLINVLAWILMGIFIGCASVKLVSPTPAPYEVDSEVFSPYLFRFKMEAEYRGVTVDLSKLHIQMVDEIAPPESDGSHLCGICYGDYEGTKHQTIFILKSYWDKSTLIEREQLVFHELGHCILFKEHNDTMKKGVPVSIMYPTTIVVMEDNDRYFRNRSKYLDELFDVNTVDNSSKKH